MKLAGQHNPIYFPDPEGEKIEELTDATSSDHKQLCIPYFLEEIISLKRTVGVETRTDMEYASEGRAAAPPRL